MLKSSNQTNSNSDSYIMGNSQKGVVYKCDRCESCFNRIHKPSSATSYKEEEHDKENVHCISMFQNKKTNKDADLKVKHLECSYSKCVICKMPCLSGSHGARNAVGRVRRRFRPFICAICEKCAY